MVQINQIYRSLSNFNNFRKSGDFVFLLICYLVPFIFQTISKSMVSESRGLCTIIFRLPGTGGILANLRPLYNSNMLKVSIVKWSQNKIFVAEVTFLAYPIFWNIAVSMQMLNLRVGQKTGLCHKKSPILRPLYIKYFCHNTTIIKWSRIFQNSNRKCSFGYTFFKDTFCIKFTIKAV